MAKQRPSKEAGIEDILAIFIRGPWFLALLSAAVICLLIVAILPWPINRFAIKASTETVEVSASEERIHEIGAKMPSYSEIKILNARIKDPPPELAIFANANSGLQLLASNALLRSITLSSGGDLTAQITRDGSIDFGVSNNGIISLTLSGKIEQVDETGRHTTIANLIRTAGINIRARSNDSPAHVLMPPGISEITLYNQPVQSFLFYKMHRLGLADLSSNESAILNGELCLLDVSTKTELQPHELVQLDGGRRFLSKLDINNGVIAIELEGDAKTISVGPPRRGTSKLLDKDLTPSVLFYLLGQSQIKLLWLAGVFVVGSLWKARQWARGWQKK